MQDGCGFLRPEHPEAIGYQGIYRDGEKNYISTTEGINSFQAYVIFLEIQKKISKIVFIWSILKYVKKVGTMNKRKSI